MGHLPCLPGTLSRACRSLDPSARHPSTWWQGPHASKEEADLGQGHMPLHSFAQETRVVGRHVWGTQALEIRRVKRTSPASTHQATWRHVLSFLPGLPRAPQTQLWLKPLTSKLTPGQGTQQVLKQGDSGRVQTRASASPT